MPEGHTPTQATQPSKDSDDQGTLLGLRFAGELGYLIALPVVILGFGGAYIDHTFHSTPLFIIIGLVLAGIVSYVGVKRKVKEIIEATHNPVDTRSQKP